ncbi:MAG: hypothetical protein HY308_01155 [Gammaproteobacteria bacterium]|nr:hypothetical protein [Gammaproteobacteria bacterium]
MKRIRTIAQTCIGITTSVVVMTVHAFDLGNGMVIPTGLPNPTTVGWKACGDTLSSLVVIPGSYTTKADNELIEHKWIKGTLKVAHKNVHVRCSRIDAATTGGRGVVYGSGTDIGGLALNLSYVEIIGPTTTGWPDEEGVAVHRSDIVVEYSDIHDVADGILLKDRMTVRYNYIHDLHHETDSHSDCLQVTSGDNWQVYNNTCLAFNSGKGELHRNADGTYSASGMANAAVMLGRQPDPATNNGNLSTITGFEVYNNFFAGGNWTVNKNEDGEAANGPISGLFRNNIFGPGMRYGMALT